MEPKARTCTIPSPPPITPLVLDDDGIRSTHRLTRNRKNGATAPVQKPGGTNNRPQNKRSQSSISSESDQNFEHHSSEEELEVINNGCCVPKCPRSNENCTHVDGTRDTPTCKNIRKTGSATRASEKRKRCERNCSRGGSENSGGSSDEEVREVLRDILTPVQFSSSPPADVRKPSRATRRSMRQDNHATTDPNNEEDPSAETAHCETSESAGATSSENNESFPPKLFHISGFSDFTPFEVCLSSPRKRHRHGGGATRRRTYSEDQKKLSASYVQHMPRPCLDFEKMRQQCERTDGSWRANHEVSLLC